MIFKQLSRLKYISKRFFHLGGWHLSAVFFMVIREQGIMTALKKTWNLLFWQQGVNYLGQNQQWYEQNNCSQLTQTAGQVFSHVDVLIIGNLDLPQCKKYRVLQKIELLEKLGFNCEIAEYHDIPRVFNKIQLATFVIFYRIPDDELFRLYKKEVDRLLIRCAYDIDDPIFSAAVYAENRNLDSLSKVEKHQLLESSIEYRNAMEACDLISVSTPGMSQLVAGDFPEQSVLLWRNVLDGETLSIVAQVDQHKVSDENTIVISYMSGSRAHDADFASIEAALVRILDKHQHIQLLMGGYAPVSAALQPYQQRIKTVIFSGYNRYFDNMRQADINIVPLLQDCFNECKSAIRYLEAAVLGIPSVTSNTGDFKNLIDSGKNGFLAADQDAWETALTDLIMDKALRLKIGKQAQSDVMEQQTVDALAQRMKTELTSLFQGNK